MNDYEAHAFELRQMLNNHPLIYSLAHATFGLIKQYAKLNVRNKTVQDDIWWPFIRSSFMDISTYGFCVYMKKTKDGIVYPVHVPVSSCHIDFDEYRDITVTPKYGKFMREKNFEKKVNVFVGFEPCHDTRTLSGPMSRLLFNYKRLNELSTCYIEEERRIAKPVLFLEDTLKNENNLYQAINAQNPSYDTSVPGLLLSARDTATENAKINQFVASLQQNMVDLINRGDVDPESAVDSLGIRKTEKRKRVQEIQVPLPAHKKATIYQPNNRVDVLAYEKFFKETVPWIFGLPISFFENTTSKVSSNYKLLETVATTAVENQVSTLNALLSHVSRKLFGLFEVILNSPMRVKLTIKESEIDYENVSKSSAPKQAQASVENNATPARTESSSKPNQQKEKKDTKENKET